MTAAVESHYVETQLYFKRKQSGIVLVLKLNKKITFAHLGEGMFLLVVVVAPATAAAAVVEGKR